MPKLNDIVTTLTVLNGFKQRRPLAVIRAELLAEVTQACSIPITESPLRKKQITEFLEMGVRYVGELCYINSAWDANGDTSRRLRMRFGTDMLAAGWRPPYWDDPTFLAVLNMPCCVYFGEFGNWKHKYNLTYHDRTFARTLHAKGVHYMGQFLRQMSSYGIYLHFEDGHTEHLTLQQILEQTGESHLWRHALVPPNWKPPEPIPAAWREEEEKIPGEIEYYETPRAWVVEWEISDGIYSGWTKLHTSYAEAAKRREIPYPFVEDTVQFKSKGAYHNHSYESYRCGKTRLSIDGQCALIFFREAILYQSWDEKSSGWLTEDSEMKYAGGVTWHIMTDFLGARAFSSKEAAEAFEQEVKARQGQPIEDEE